MARWTFGLFLRSQHHRDHRAGNIRRRVCPIGFEAMEDRIVPASHTWNGNGQNGLWATKNNWGGNVPTETTLPGATLADQRFVSSPTTMTWAAGTVTVTYSSGKPFVANSMIVINDVNPATYDNNLVPVPITYIDDGTFTYPLANDPGTFVSGGDFTVVQSNNIPNLLVDNLTFAASGDVNVLAGPLTSSLTPVIGGSAINLVGSSAITVNSNASNSAGLTFISPIQSQTGIVNLGGAGTIAFDVPAANAIPNAYSQLIDTANLVKELLPEQIPDTANLTLNGSNVTYNMNSQTETLASLSVLATSGTGLETGGSAGHVIVNGNLTFSGGTITLNNGSEIDANSLTDSGGTWNFGTSATLAVGSGGLSLSGGVTIPINNNSHLSLSGGVASSGDATDNITSTGSGNLVLSGNQIFSVGDGASAVDLSISAPIVDGTTLGGITKTGSGTLVLSGNNSFTGGLTVNGGTLTTANAISTTNSLAVSNLNTGATGTAVVLDLPTTVPTTVTSLSGSVAVPTSGSNTATINNGGQLLTVNPSSATTFAGTIAGSGGLSLSSTLASNSLTLAGTNTYTGSTTLGLAATLLVNGATDPASSVSVGPAATLGGTGIIGGSVTVSGTLKPAAATTTGTLTVGGAGVGDVTFAAGSNFDVNLTAAGSDELIVAGTANLTNATLNVNGADNAPIGTPITILHAGNLAGTSFVGLPNNTTFTQAGQTYTINYDYVAGNVTLIHWHSPAFTSSDHAGFVVGAASTFNVTTSGYPAVTLSEDPTDPPLPASISFSPATGVFSGTPTSADIGVYTLHFIAHSGFGSDALQTFTLTIGVPPGFTSASYTLFNVGSNGNFPVTASGMPTPTISESMTDTLPGGVTFAGGVLAGTPTTAGIYPLHFTAANGTVDATQTFTLFVGPLATVYVSSAFAGRTAGDFIADADNVTAGSQPAIFGTSAFATIDAAIAATTMTSGTIVVSAGTYAESPNLAGSQTLVLAGDVVVNSIDSAAGSTIDLGTHNLTTGVPAGNNTLAGLVTGTGSLTKVGSDTLTILGNDNYTGGTTVSAGALIVNGSLSPSSTVSIVGSGILGGIGSVGNVTNSGIVNPGSPGAPGTLAVAGNLTLGSGSLVLDLAASGSDSVNATGSAVAISGTTLSLNVGTMTPGETFTILTVPGTSAGVLQGTFANLPMEGSGFTVGSIPFTVSYMGGDGNDVTVTAGRPCDPRQHRPERQRQRLRQRHTRSRLHRQHARPASAFDGRERRLLVQLGREPERLELLDLGPDELRDLDRADAERLGRCHRHRLDGDVLGSRRQQRDPLDRRWRI
jgi:fibronectin-binding autotransporter adhesin